MVTNFVIGYHKVGEHVKIRTLTVSHWEGISDRYLYLVT